MRTELANLEANIARDEHEYAAVVARWRAGDGGCCPQCDWENGDRKRARRAERRVERRRQILVKLFRDSGQYEPLPRRLTEPED